MACPTTGCDPKIVRIRGYYQIFIAFISYTPVASITFMDRHTIADLNLRWVQPQILKFINAGLKQYNHDVRVQVPRAYEMESIKKVKIILLIKDDIIVQSIPAIDQLVCSMKFESEADNLVHVSCCEDVHVFGSQQKSRSGTKKKQTDLPCGEMTCNENNSTTTLVVNSVPTRFHVSQLSIIFYLWLSLKTVQD